SSAGCSRPAAARRAPDWPPRDPGRGTPFEGLARPRDKGGTMRRVGTAPLCALLLGLTVVAYLPLWRNDFVDLDDEMYVTDNPPVLRGLSWSGIRWAFTTVHAGYWQPLSWLSLQWDARLFFGRSEGGQPVPSAAAVHGHNFFWHAASTLLLFALWQ